MICTFELTRRCNLSCRHCYIGPSLRNAGADCEITTAQAVAALEQLARAGTLQLVFTGGEVFLRPDILELCGHARRLGFDLRLFSNATLIGDKEAAALAALHVSAVEVSLYGRRETHDRVTRSRGSFSRTLRAVRLLRDRGVRVVFKTPVMKDNCGDYPWLLSFGRKLSIPVKFDPAVVPRDDGDRSVLRHRMTDGQLRRFYRDPRLAEKAEPDGCSDGQTGTGTVDLLCSAGRNLLAVGYDGTVYPCLQLRLPLGSFREHGFPRIWNARNPALKRLRSITAADLRECASCRLASACQRCPGLALLEDGDLLGPATIACRTARIKHSPGII